MEIDRRTPMFVSLWSAARARADLPGLLSLFIFLAVTAVLFRSWEFALLVTASLGFHEMGHAVALARFRLEFRIYFGVAGAYTWSSLPAREGLSQLRNTLVHLAGPLFSLGLAMAALLLHRLWLPDEQHLLVLANFSAQVGFLNLLPFGALTDGGKALRRIALSTRSRREHTAILLLVEAVLVGSLLALAWPVWQSGPSAMPATAAGFLLICAWLGASWMLEMSRHAQVGLQRGVLQPVPAAKPPRPMKSLQLLFIALLLWDMLAAMLLVILETPFWLEPRYLLGSLRNIELLFAWLAAWLR